MNFFTKNPNLNLKTKKIFFRGGGGGGVGEARLELVYFFY